MVPLCFMIYDVVNIIWCSLFNLQAERLNRFTKALSLVPGYLAARARSGANPVGFGDMPPIN